MLTNYAQDTFWLIFGWHNWPKTDVRSLPWQQPGVKRGQDVRVSFSHVKICQMSQWFGRLLEHVFCFVFYKNRSITLPAYWFSSPKLPFACLDLCLSAKNCHHKKRKAACKSQRRKKTFHLVPVLSSKSTGTKPKENLTPCRVRSCSMNEFAYIRNKKKRWLDWVGKCFLCLGSVFHTVSLSVGQRLVEW